MCRRSCGGRGGRLGVGVAPVGRVGPAVHPNPERKVGDKGRRVRRLVSRVLRRRRDDGLRGLRLLRTKTRCVGCPPRRFRGRPVGLRRLGMIVRASSVIARSVTTRLVVAEHTRGVVRDASLGGMIGAGAAVVMLVVKMDVVVAAGTAREAAGLARVVSPEGAKAAVVGVRIVVLIVVRTVDRVVDLGVVGGRVRLARRWMPGLRAAWPGRLVMLMVMMTGRTSPM